MTLYEIIFNVISKVEQEKGNFERKEEIHKKVSYILKHSSMKYNSNVFRLESYSAFGVEHWKDVELELPRYMIFRISHDMKNWVFKSYTDITFLEFDLIHAENVYQIVLMDAIIKEYNIVEDTYSYRVIWSNPIYQIEYIEQNENKAVLIYDRVELEDKIKELIAEEIEDIKVFSITENSYIDFYIKDVIFSTTDNNLPFEIYWGKSEMTFMDISEDDGEYYEENEEYIW